MDTQTIEKLLTLARLSISDEEKDHLSKDLANILSYVEQIEQLPNEVFKESHGAINALREDVVTNVPHQYTDVLIEEMPENEKGYLKVKQIL